MIDQEKKEEMVREAKARYKCAVPCGGRNSFDDCFTFFEDAVLLWFDDSIGSTHVVKRPLN